MTAGWADKSATPPPVEDRIPIDEICDSIERLAAPVQPPGTYSTADTVSFPDPDALDEPATLQSESVGAPTLPERETADTDVSHPSQGRRNAEALLRVVGVLRRLDSRIAQLQTHQGTHPRLADFEGRLGHMESRVEAIEGTFGTIGKRLKVLHSHGVQIWVLIGFAGIGYGLNLGIVVILLAVLAKLARL